VNLEVRFRALGDLSRRPCSFCLSFIVALSALFFGANELNFTTNTWVTILLLASYDLFLVIRASCRSRT